MLDPRGLRRGGQRSSQGAGVSQVLELRAAVPVDVVEDIAGRVIAEGLKPEETFMAKVMTRNPVFVMSNSSAIEALQKMVQGKFRHLPVVEHGEVIAIVDIKKFLYDAISRMEKAAEQGSAIAAAMEGVEK